MLQLLTSMMLLATGPTAPCTASESPEWASASARRKKELLAKCHLESPAPQPTMAPQPSTSDAPRSARLLGDDFPPELAGRISEVSTRIGLLESSRYGFGGGVTGMVVGLVSIPVGVFVIALANFAPAAPLLAIGGVLIVAGVGLVVICAISIVRRTLANGRLDRRIEALEGDRKRLEEEGRARPISTEATGAAVTVFRF